MSQIHQALPGRRKMARPTRLLQLAILLLLPAAATAHGLFTNYVQHSAQLVVGARHIDLTLDLTFFEEWSARERRAMDADNNGRITRPELESYLKQRAPELAGPVTLRVAGQELQLVPLYDPEVDLLANEQTGPGHHRLRLFFFAPTPTTLRAEDEIVVHDRFWPEAKFLGTTQAEGRDGCQVSTEISIQPGFSSEKPDRKRCFQFRCVKAPTAKTATPTQSTP